jgi:tRNA threonylcarbamoyladenosine biosynthesis protein TsaB
MTLFYIDTTSSYLYTAIVRDNSLLIERKKDLGKSLSIETTNIVSEMFNEVNLKPSDINKIIVVNGPGSFTGIRIGVTLAKIMAYTQDIPITTITSLEAMAKSIDTDKLIVPIINARREACYAAIYDGNKEIMVGSYLTIEKLKMMLIGLNKDYVFISNDKFSFECEKYAPDILNIVNFYKDRERINPHLVNPLYLKLTEAEENRLKDND